MKKALPAIALSAAGVTWLLHAQGVIDSSATSSAQPGATARTTPAAPSTAPSNGPPNGTSVSDGSVADTRFGPVRVEAVLSGSELVDVKVLAYPNEHPRSQEINAQALPMLHDQAVAAHSAQIDGVSGATYTSIGYQQSLQAALDAAK
jgi:uncharacterized protein with FMN-binding domain